MKSPTPLQSYMRHWKSFDKLKEEFGINYYRHPSLPLVGVKYNQIESPKKHPIVVCSRGTILEDNTYNIVAQPMCRFFNYGESWEEEEIFDWSNFYCNTKVDGSLVIVYHYNNEWHVNTSGSFGFGEMHTVDGYPLGFTWRDLFWRTIGEGFSKEKLNPDYTYCFELCTLFNKVVVNYDVHSAYLLSITNHKYDPYELSYHEVDTIADELGVKRPKIHNFSSIDDIKKHLDTLKESGSTEEGVVICDRNHIRFKLKNELYLSLHHMKDNGNSFRIKNIIPWVMENNQDELLVYFKEAQDIVDKVVNDVNQEWIKLYKVWKDYNKITDQKEFALAIKGKTKFTGLLFTLRKEYGIMQTEEMLKTIWRNSGDLIYKVLYK